MNRVNPYDYQEKPYRVPAIFWTVGVVLLIVLIVIGATVISAITTTDPGVITVVRNGGWFDNRQVRQVDGKPQILPAGSSLTWIGAWSSTHSYPVTQRYFKVSSRPDADSNEVIDVPTRDGTRVGVEGVFYFNLNTDPAVLGQFDDRYGTRTYPAPGGGKLLHAWEGDEGWTAFLNATLGNLVQNDLRREIAKTPCVDLIASCALAQPGQDAAAVLAAAQANPAAADKLTVIQDAVNAQFAADVTRDLGGPYFTNIRFVISKIALPDGVQKAIDDAKASFAAITKAQAGKAAAEIDAQTMAVRQGGYSLCSTCADIDKEKAIPPTITTYAPGAQFAVTGK